MKSNRMQEQTAQHSSAWSHPELKLEGIIEHFESFIKIQQMTCTSKFLEWEENTIIRAIQWATYIEQVMESLGGDGESQSPNVRILLKCLQTRVGMELPYDHLARARLFLLRSILHSDYMSANANAEAILKVVIVEYSDLDYHNADTNSNTPNPAIELFMKDFNEKMKTQAISRILTEACLVLSTAQQQNIQRQRQEYKTFCASEYFTSMDTMKKRAYSLQIYTHLETLHVEDKAQCKDNSKSLRNFCLKLESMANEETNVLEVICLCLYEPIYRCSVETPECRRVVLEFLQETQYQNNNIILKCLERYKNENRTEEHGSLSVDVQKILNETPPVRDLLEIVLKFKSDPRLWNMNPFLLAELSEHYFSIARYYLSYIITSHEENIDIDGANQAFRTTRFIWSYSEITSRLRILVNRSERLGNFVKIVGSKTNLRHLI